MNTKNIFKTVALAMMMPAMLLTTACSNQDDIANTSNITNKGYALPVTVSATRGGDATRATFDGSKLNFSDGDKLFVEGKYATGSKSFAGALDYVSEGTFSGTIYTQDNTYSTYNALLAAASSVKATLLPAGYGSTGFISINDNSTPELYDDKISASSNNAFVASETAKATGVEQLSLEQASTYSSSFALTPRYAILNFTISGLEAGAKEVSLRIHRGMFDIPITGSVTPNASGVATFAIGVQGGSNIKDMDNNLTVGTHNFTLPSSTTFAAGKIYNIARSATGAPSLIDAFVNGNETIITFGNSGSLSATYNNGFGEVTKTGTLSAMLSSATMTRNGDNLVVEVTIVTPYGDLIGSLTINTLNNTYYWSDSKVGSQIELSGITIGGNDITPLPTPAS